MLITLEGGEGAGKTTQKKRITDEEILSLSLFEQMPIGRALAITTIQEPSTSIDNQNE